MPKPSITVGKSYEGRIKVRATASAWANGTDVSATVSINLALEDAKAFQLKLAMEIHKAEERVAAKAAKEARRQAWRNREVAAGRIEVISASEFFGR